MDYPISGILAVFGFVFSVTWAVYAYLIDVVSDKREKLEVTTQKWLDSWFPSYNAIFANLACILLFIISMSTGSTSIQTANTYICFFISLKVIFNILASAGSYQAYYTIFNKLYKPYNGRNIECWMKDHRERSFFSKVTIRYLDFLGKKATWLNPKTWRFKVKKICLFCVNSDYLINFFINAVLAISAILIINPLRSAVDGLNTISLKDFIIDSQEIKNLIWLYSFSTIYSAYSVIQEIPRINIIISNTVKSTEYYDNQIKKYDQSMNKQ